MSLSFLQGIALPDPGKRLQGSGNVVRHVRLAGPDSLDEPEISTLIEEALHRAKVPLDPKARRKLIIKSVATKQRARRPTIKPKSRAKPTQS